jgi:hypothetical protein
MLARHRMKSRHYQWRIVLWNLLALTWIGAMLRENQRGFCRAYRPRSHAIAEHGSWDATGLYSGGRVQATAICHLALEIATGHRYTRVRD